MKTLALTTLTAILLFTQGQITEAKTRPPKPRTWKLEAENKEGQKSFKAVYLAADSKYVLLRDEKAKGLKYEDGKKLKEYKLPHGYQLVEIRSLTKSGQTWIKRKLKAKAKAEAKENEWLRRKTPDWQGYKRVKVGMPSKQVAKLLGKNPKKHREDSSGYGGTTIEFLGDYHTFYITFQDGVVTSKTYTGGDLGTLEVNEH